MAEERNFRSYYYDKFGFRVVEEKKSIEILLKEQPAVSTEKLQQFCLRFTLPAMYRVHVWKLLLGIIASNHGSSEFILKNRQQQHQDLRDAVDLICTIRDTDPPELRVLKMYLIETGQLPFMEIEIVTREENVHFLGIARGVCKLTDDDFDRFWVASRFYQLVSKHTDTFALYPDMVLKCLKKEDQDQKLWTHLMQHKVLPMLPLKLWFNTCFVDVLPDITFQRIWDRIMGGSLYVMVYVAVAILLFFRRPLLSMSSAEDMVNYLKQIPEDCGDRIVNDALDLWSKNGSLLIMAKSDSPAVVDKTKPS